MGTYGCSSECFAYDCNPIECDFVDEDDFCKQHSSAVGDQKEDASNENGVSDICALASP